MPSFYFMQKMMIVKQTTSWCANWRPAACRLTVMKQAHTVRYMDMLDFSLNKSGSNAVVVFFHFMFIAPRWACPKHGADPGHAGEIISLGWPGNVSVSPRKSWWMSLLKLLPRDPELDKWRKMKRKKTKCASLGKVVEFSNTLGLMTGSFTFLFFLSSARDG